MQKIYGLFWLLLFNSAFADCQKADVNVFSRLVFSFYIENINKFYYEIPCNKKLEDANVYYRYQTDTNILDSKFSIYNKLFFLDRDTLLTEEKGEINFHNWNAEEPKLIKLKSLVKDKQDDFDKNAENCDLQLTIFNCIHRNDYYYVMTAQRFKKSSLFSEYIFKFDAKFNLIRIVARGGDI
jgi:hypothetical protein